uniref:Uncharacterized protein n=1 Tax=Trichobilharzia regenti TaxID=157069 RepID=A0AA85J6N9_TRIRE|nr:unnamed protein product [Trichobilharzia regenti]
MKPAKLIHLIFCRMLRVLCLVLIGVVSCNVQRPPTVLILLPVPPTNKDTPKSPTKPAAASNAGTQTAETKDQPNKKDGSNETNATAVVKTPAKEVGKVENAMRIPPPPIRGPELNLRPGKICDLKSSHNTIKNELWMICQPVVCV